MLVGCGGNDDTPSPPQPALLEFPLQNSECTEGVAIDGTNTSRLEFRWQPSNNTETYELRVTNLNTDVPQTITSETTSASLILERGVPYSWVVTSRNSRVTETSSSETWQFYNAGSQTTYAPFPAEIISPKSGASVGKDQNNELFLEWSGADVDNDIVSYDVFFSSSTPPQTLIASPSANTTSIQVSVASNTIYYWRIITRDGEGNTSDTGIFEFKVL
ncbi:MAG: hypothetical protein WBG90_03460 [Saonia sp.]